jgi:N-acetylglucosaminyldiphosphoundecaprenol N-acetyl-beta-D-mannosaminyltransferase
MAIQSIRVLGAEVQALTMLQLNDLIAETIACRGRLVLANHNLHSLYLYHRDSKMRQFYGMATHIHVDGMPIVAMARLLGAPIAREHRVTYVDWIGPLMALAAESNWRVFYVGSKPGVGLEATRVLTARHPDLQMQTAHGFFNPAPHGHEDREVVDRINTFRPHLLILGMGMPRQEHWLVDHLDRLNANVFLNGGAAMDYVAGVVPTPPRWAGRCGLEWLFRLGAEPRRLWKRYLVEPWYVLPRFAAELVQARAAGSVKR